MGTEFFLAASESREHSIQHQDFEIIHQNTRYQGNADSLYTNVRENSLEELHFPLYCQKCNLLHDAGNGRAECLELLKPNSTVDRLTDEVATLPIIMQKRKTWLIDYLFSVVENLKAKTNKQTNKQKTQPRLFRYSLQTMGTLLIRN